MNIARMLDFCLFAWLGSRGFTASVLAVKSYLKFTCGVCFSSYTFSRTSSEEVICLNSAYGFRVLWTRRASFVLSVLLIPFRVASLDTFSCDSLCDPLLGEDIRGLPNSPGVACSEKWSLFLPNSADSMLCYEIVFAAGVRMLISLGFVLNCRVGMAFGFPIPTI